MKDFFRNHLKTKSVTLLLAIAFVGGFSFEAQATIHEGGDLANGERLFKGICASCHKPTAEELAAPGLLGIDKRWKGKDELLVQWIQNPNAAIATGDAYVLSMVDQWKPKYGMMAGQAVSEQDVNDIMSYVASYVPPVDTSGGGDDHWYEWDVAGEETTSLNGNSIWFIVIGLFFLIVALSARNVAKNIRSLKHQITNFKREDAGKAPRPELSLAQSAKKWVWDNKGFVTVIGLFITAYFVVVAYQGAMGVGVYEGYRPEQPIKYSHKLHAGKNKIDCQYCHHTASKSKHASIPSTNVCMNCHKAIKEGHNEEFTAEIQKIYDAIGWDPDNNEYIADYEEKPVEWVRVHNLPDHVYFNHQQHVVAGKLQCQNCHGPVEQEYTVGRIASVEEAAAYKPVDGLPEGKRPIIKLTKPTLTMGWCIECHGEAKIQVIDNDNAYYQEIHDRMKNSERGREELRRYLDGKTFTLKELGGWECAKCHY